jgi:hypothetical protein
MDGAGTTGSGSTPAPDPALSPGPTLATPAEVAAAEAELLGLVVDAPEAGGLGLQATHAAGGAPATAALQATADDVAAYVGLVELSQPTPPLPGVGAVGSPQRLGRLMVASGVMGLFGVFLLLAVLASGAGGGGAPGDGSTTGAGGLAAPAQPAGAAIPASCLVPEGSVLDLELTDVSWNEEEDGLNASWNVLVHNRESDTFQVFLHDVADANAATRANKWVGRPTDWRTDGTYIIAPDPEAPVINSWSGGVSTSVEPGLPTFCSWEYVDRLVAVYSGPECRDDLWAQLKAAPDAASREALMRPLAIDMPTPEKMKTFQCPP